MQVQPGLTRMMKPLSTLLRSLSSDSVFWRTLHPKPGNPWSELMWIPQCMPLDNYSKLG